MQPVGGACVVDGPLVVSITLTTMSTHLSHRAAAFGVASLIAVMPPIPSDDLGGVDAPSIFGSRVLVAPRPPRVVMADNFTTASAVEGRAPQSVGTGVWRQIAGNWAVRNGYLDPPNSTNALVLYPAGVTDLETTLAITITGVYRFGPAVRAAADGSSYLVGYVTNTGLATIARHVGQAVTVLASAQLSVLAGTFTVRVSVAGSTLTLWRDGVEVLTADVGAASPTATYSGVWVSSSGNEQLDDIRITTGPA